jgi:hypothetical protein
MSRAVRVLAQAALQDGNTSEALDKVITAACINPFGTYIDRAQLRTLLDETAASVRHTEGERGYQQALARIRVRLGERGGIHACLDDVTTDCSNAISTLFQELGSPAREN